MYSVTQCFFPTSLDLIGILTFAQIILVVLRPLKWGYNTLFLLKLLFITPRIKIISSLSQKILSPLSELLPRREQKYVISNSFLGRLKLRIQAMAPKGLQYYHQTIQIRSIPSGLPRFVHFYFCLSKNVPYFFGLFLNSYFMIFNKPSRGTFFLKSCGFSI